jgi:hypothetical protein
MIRPSDPSVIPSPEFQSNFFGCSDLTKSDRTRYGIHQPGLGIWSDSLVLDYCGSKDYFCLSWQVDGKVVYDNLKEWLNYLIDNKIFNIVVPTVSIYFWMGLQKQKRRGGRWRMKEKWWRESKKSKLWKSHEDQKSENEKEHVYVKLYWACYM